MKLLKPLKYVITAAAVCILCFSGNGEYFYAVFAVSPENDIVELPQQNGLPNGKANSNESGRCSINKNYIKKYAAVLCNILPCHSDCCNDFGSAFSVDMPVSGRQNISVSESRTLYRLFSVKHPGNRSPW
ncbi:MAG: hypothetical protein ACI4Q5_03895 [Porcipelethomonas sp.]